jgi:hypothetical protein
MIKDIIKSCFHFNNLKTLFIVFIITYLISNSIITATIIGFLNVLLILLVYIFIKFGDKD